MSDLTPYAGAIVTALVFIIGSYIAMKNANNEKFNALSVQITALTTKLDDLKEQTEKHNKVIERTYKLESDMNTAFKRIDELKARDDKLEERMGR